MESTLLSPGSHTMSVLLLSKSLSSRSTPLIAHLHRRFSTTPATQLAYLQLSRCLQSGRSGPGYLARGLGPLELRRNRLQFSARYQASYASGGGGFGGIDGGAGGGGGDGAAEGGDAKPSAVAPGATYASTLSTDVIILDVRGMTCGGCAASVKRILESQPQVSSASVNLTTETAVVWPVSEAKVAPNWKKEVGEALAKHLTSCGFNSNLRDLRRTNIYETFEKKINEKHALLKESGRGLVVSWALCAVCIVGHLSHFFGAKAAWIHALHSTGFHMSLSLFTLLGPGRQLIKDGLKSLLRGAPNMNTLVGLGALSSFTVSTLAAFMPKLGWKTFFEEPVMLIAFVLLGRNLEQRAKIKATSDMTSLLSILPAKARLLINGNAEDLSSTVEVPSNSLSVGDQIVVLPGDRIPADGVVRAGRSSVDESSFTGEPLPVTKLPGAEVAAGSINLNGKIIIEVRRSGGETAIGDIVRLVEEAQTREAPVQRLADKVAGHFTYGVMALSAATFMFWNLFGSRILPATLYQGNSMSLALQLSCSVLVVACPCALGLATPTAVLVGTSLGATKGLLLRGGSILEIFSTVNTIVFDKTGTLTIGKPIVTKVVVQDQADKNLEQDSSSTGNWSEVEVLKLAAGVESSTIHPIGKAIVEAAKISNCPNVKVVDGTFTEEPGSGAVAIIDEKKVAVGTLEWVQRHGVVGNSPFQEVEEFKNQSVVYVGVDGVLAGVIYVEDQIREDARQNSSVTLSAQRIRCHGCQRLLPISIGSYGVWTTGPTSEVKSLELEKKKNEAKSFYKSFVKRFSSSNPPQEQTSRIPPTVTTYLPPRGKRALICGVSYKKQKHELKGTAQDVKNIKNLLIQEYSFPEESILILAEGGSCIPPTRKNIEDALRWLVRGIRSGDSLVFYFSGHGKRQRDLIGDEIDGFDETICPMDFETNGMILDNDINDAIVRPLPTDVTLHAIVDSCHSGTVLDLPHAFNFTTGKWDDNRPPSGTYKGTNGGKAICFSACEDYQLAADTSAFSVGKEMTGAMTTTFIQAIKATFSKKEKLTYQGILDYMHLTLKQAHKKGHLSSSIRRIFHRRILQDPLLSASEEFSTNAEFKL